MTRVVAAMGVVVLSNGLAFALPQERLSGDERSQWWGVAVGTHATEARRRGFPYPPDLREVADLGATHVSLTVSWVQRDRTGSTLAPGPDTVSDTDLVATIRAARRAGLGVVLVPIVELAGGARSDWRGNIAPDDPDRWWREYGRFVLRYARIAERGGIGLFAIGSELSSMSGDADAPRWATLARRVRAEYRGRLLYAANHDALDRRSPFAVADVVGVSAYFPLADTPDADPAAMRAAWRAAAARLEDLQHAIEKPLVIIEVGYPSIDGGAMVPWDHTRGTPIDLDEQRDAYRAFVDATIDAPFLSGAFFWTWFGPGGPHDAYYTPRDKPAEAEVARLLRHRAPRRPPAR